MHILRFAVLILPLLLVCSSSAQGEIKRLVGFGGIELKHGKLGGDLARNLRTDKGVGVFVFGGLKIDNVDLRLTFGLPEELRTNRPDLHGKSIHGAEVGPDLRYVFYSNPGHFRLYGRVGLHRLWWNSMSSVTRRCKQTADCRSGFWQEFPSYTGTTTRIGVGAEMTPLNPQRRLYLTFSADIGYEMVRMKMIRENEFGHLITASLHVAIGGGRNRTWY